MNWTSIIGIALWALLPGFIAKKKGRSFWAYYLLSFVITPLITTIITLCLSKIKEEEQPVVQSEVEVVERTIVAESTEIKPEEISSRSEVSNEVPRKIMYCRRCGSKLIEGSEFCSSCGNKIEKETDI